MDYDKAPEISVPEFLTGGGEMGERIRSFDWAKTSLGSFHTWPGSLRTCIRIMLASRQPIWIGWGKELIKFYNDPYKAIVGGKHPEALGQPASVVWKDIWKDIAPMLRQVMENDQGTYVESQLLIMERHGYPEETYYTFSYTPIPGDDGGTAGMICANTDDTERIISERQLRTLTELGKQLTVNHSEENIFDKTIGVLEQNQHDFPFALLYARDETAARLVSNTHLGANKSQVPAIIDSQNGHPLAAIFDGITDGNKIALITELKEKLGPMPAGPWQKSPENAVVIAIQSGQTDPYGYLVVGLNPYRQPDTKYLNFFQLIADQVATSIVIVRRMEEERKRAEALAELDRAKTTFFSNISHEFRTPLTLMLAPIEDMLADPGTIPRNRARMEVAHRNALRLLKLVNTLLDFSRIEAGRMEINLLPLDLPALTADLASSFRSAIERAGIEYFVDCKPLEGPVFVDPDLWEKIVLNLVSNAFKYTEKGRIEVKMEQQGDEVILTVADSGVGIAEDELVKIFERFHRVQTVQGRSQEGTGIGLSLVQELVWLHEGEIRVESTPGKGSVFTVNLPFRKGFEDTEPAVVKSVSDKGRIYSEEAQRWVTAEEDAENFSISVSETGTPGHVKARILLADDNADMRLYVKRLLSEKYEVDVVSNGIQAMESIRQQVPDLVISDVMMPGMNGFELLHEIKSRSQYANLPVILLSARAGEEATVEGLDAGADDYLVKPFSAKELMSRVSSTIKTARARMTAEKNMYNIFMKTPVAIMVFKGKEFTIELANTKALAIIGRNQEEVVGKAVREALPEVKGQQSFFDHLESVFTSGTPFLANELPFQFNRYGVMETLILNFVLEPLFDEEENISGILASALDVTELVSARNVMQQNKDKLELLVSERTRELQTANVKLARSNVELEQFAHVASHDLKEPLRKIKTFASRLQDELQDTMPEKGVTFLNKIQSSANRMYAMMEGVLVYSSINAGEHKIGRVDLNEIIDDICTDLELIIQRDDVLIEKGPLPVIEGASVLIYQLFYNLLNNSLKFSSKSRRPVIRISSVVFSDNGNDYAKIEVEDNGIGFNQEYSENIFNTFTRLHAKDKYEGTGLGLSLGKKIVERHRGSISAKGIPNEGATFTVIIPLRQDQALA